MDDTMGSVPAGNLETKTKAEVRAEMRRLAEERIAQLGLVVSPREEAAVLHHVRLGLVLLAIGMGTFWFGVAGASALSHWLGAAASSLVVGVMVGLRAVGYTVGTVGLIWAAYNAWKRPRLYDELVQRQESAVRHERPELAAAWLRVTQGDPFRHLGGGWYPVFWAVGLAYLAAGMALIGAFGPV